MKKRLIFIITGIMTLVIGSGGCSVDPESRLGRVLDRYLESDAGSLLDLQMELVRYASIESFEGKDLQSNGTLLYHLDGTRAKVSYPRSLTLDLTDGEEVTQVAADDNHAVITDGLQIAVFSGSGSHIYDQTIGDKKNRVRSLALDGDSVLYYKNSRVYRYGLSVKTSEELTKESFTSPFTSYYNAMIVKNDALVGVCAGIAGSYSFSIINTQTGTVVLKNLGMSSSRYFMGAKALYYMTGTSGKWELVRFDIATKAKKSITGFTDLTDIVPAATGYICETSTGLWTALYGNDRQRIPFTYELAGSYNGRVLLHYKGVYYIVEMARLHAGLQKIMERAPELFTASK
jgi:hypothetical protein